MSYSGVSFVTSDDVADALLDLAAALPQAEVVEVSVLDDSGALQSARVVIGPSSHLIAIPDKSVYPESTLQGVAEKLRQRAKQARSSQTATATSTDSIARGFEELEFP